MSARHISSRPSSLVATLLLAALAGCHGPAPEESQTSDTVLVSVETAHRGPIRALVHATGVVVPAPGAEQTVVAPQAARILEIPHAEGERVRKGDLLVRLEIPSLVADISARESDLLKSEARLENADAALVRVSGLFERGIAAGKEVEEARREKTEAKAALDEAQGARAAASLLEQRATVRALFAGVVASRTHNAGDLVDAGASEVLVRLIDPDRLQVESAVPVDELPGIGEGSAATVSSSSSYPVVEARVLALPPAVDPQTATATVRLVFLGPSQLPAGTPVQVTIVARQSRDALVVPAAALVLEGDDAFVYTVDAEDRAHRRKVATGLVSDREVEILSGIEAGERVVVQGQSALPDGAAVSVRS